MKKITLLVSISLPFILLIILICTIVFVVKKNEKVQVIILDGALEGMTFTDFDGGFFYGFKRIPYAQPPVGNKRFRPAIKNTPWNGILDATQEMPKCLQPNREATAEIGSEDCLYLNVFTSQVETDALKPVMIFIHGGSFLEGSGGDYGPELLMTEDIVLVMINYRVGVYGFINLLDSTNGEEPIANLGFKDQILAMQWVQSNIRHFGGDPNEVTLCGHSAGAISVHLQMLSPIASGLFHRVIIMSGTALMPKLCTKRNTVFQVCELLSIDTRNHSQMMEKMRQVPSSLLFQASKSLNWFSSGLNTLDGPGLVIEKESTNSFLHEYPLQIMKSNNYSNVPMLMGHVDKEGLQTLSTENCFTDYFDGNVPYHFMNREEVKEKIKRFYDFRSTNEQGRISMYSDIYCRFPSIRTATEHIKNNNNLTLYYYEFGCNTKLNIQKRRLNISHYEGACHSDELGYLFTFPDMEMIIHDSEEEIMMKLIVKIWANFTKTGKPLQGWQPFGLNEYHFVNITNDGIEIGLIGDSRLGFWAEVYNNYSYGLC